MEKKYKSIRSRISLIYMSLIGIIVVLGAVSLWSVTNINQSVSSLITTNYNSIERLAIMETALKEQRQNILLYLYDDDEQKQILNFQENTKNFIEAYNKEYATIIIPEEMKTIVTIMTKYNQFKDTFEIIQTYNKDDDASFKLALQYYDNMVSKEYENTLLQIGNLRASNEKVLFARKDETSAIVQNTAYLLCLMFILAALISYFTFRYYTNKLFGPIYEITQNLKSIRQGNLNRKANIQDTDELGSLCNEFNNMTQRLTEFEQSTLGSLMEERNKTYAIVRSITEPMVILDNKSQITLINQSFEKLFNVKFKDVEFKHFLEAMINSKLGEDAAKINYKSEQYWDKTIKLNGNRKSKYYNVMVTPIFDTAEPAKNFTIIVFYDVTEMKLLEKMQIDFIATISHEFKTPLTSIIMGTDLLANDQIGPINKDQKEIIETLKEDGQQLNILVNDLLELSKVESSNRIYQFKPMTIDSAITQCIKQFKPRFKQNEITVTTSIEPDLPKVLGDYSKIVWVLNNLVSNALKYTDKGGMIKISAVLHDNHLLVSVEDNGTGIPEDFLEKIFDKYVQVPGYDLETRGTGLGLAAAKEIIMAHKGEIWCESSVDKGSIFYFTVPIEK